MDRVAVKLEQDLMLMDRSYGEEQVRSRSMNQRSHDDMKLIISFKEDQGKC